MFGGLTIQAVFLVVIGAALLVTGTSGLRRSIRMKKQKAQRTGKILRISHVEKRDEEGFLIQNYYETRIEYVENGHRQQATVKSVDEFQEGETKRLVMEDTRRRCMERTVLLVTHDAAELEVLGVTELLTGLK